MIRSNAIRRGGSCGKRHFASKSCTISTCLSFLVSLLRLSSVSSRTRSRSSRRRFSCCNTPSVWHAPKGHIETHLKLHGLLLLTLCLTRRIRRPRLQMQALQQRCTPPRLPFQTPIPTHHQDELGLLPDNDLVHILQDALDDERGDEWGPGFVCLCVSTGGFGELVRTAGVRLLECFFGCEGGGADVLLLFLESGQWGAV